MNKSLKLTLSICIASSIVLFSSCKPIEPDASASAGGASSSEDKPKAEKKKKAEGALAESYSSALDEGGSDSVKKYSSIVDEESALAESHSSSLDEGSSDSAKKYSSISKDFTDAAGYVIDSTVASESSISAKTDIIPPPAPADIPIDATVPIPIEGQVS